MMVMIHGPYSRSGLEFLFLSILTRGIGMVDIWGGCVRMIPWVQNNRENTLKFVHVRLIVDVK